jgi:CBS domain-containing protein/sporulation protein YlmC with PRC-barrel domain
MTLISLSEIVKKPVIDVHGNKVGTLVDVIVSADMPYPIVKALTVRTPHKHTLNVSWAQVEGLGSQILLKVGRDEIRPYDAQERELHLVGGVLDREVIDVKGKRMRRVNDLQLSTTDDACRLIGVNIGIRGILRRFGMEEIANRTRVRFEGNYISWDDVDVLHSGPAAVQLKVPKHKIDTFHAADIADILEQLSVNDGLYLINALSEEDAADTLKEMSPERQVALIEGMKTERMVEILEEMSPDDAVDLLGDLPTDRSEAILDQMTPDESKNIRSLLEYPKDSAGGIMTNEFIAVSGDLTVQQATEEIRSVAAGVETIYYLYITTTEGALVGAISLRELLLARPEEKLAAFMHTDLVTVNEKDAQHDVAKKMAKYNLLALPVVDDEKKLKGVVTIDDALDVVLSTAWKKRVS